MIPIDQDLVNRELGRQIMAAMATLPDPYRAVFVLADLEHKSMKEVAAHLSITVPNVKTRLHRARLRMRAELMDYLRPAVASRAA